MSRSALPWRGAVIPLLLVVAAEAAMRVNAVQSDALAAPTQVLLALGRAIADGSLWTASLQTVGAALGGLLIGGGLGLAMGIWFGLARGAANGSALTVELLRPIPSVALIPVAMLVFGFGYRLELFVVAFTCFFPMLLLTHAAVRGVEPRLLEVSRVLGLNAVQRVFKIVLPAALPRVFVAFRLGVGVALVVAVTTEIASNPQGLGYGLIAAQQNLAPDLMLALLLWVGLLGWGLSAGLLALQKRLFGAQGAAQ
jgi:NitT/TauT family transport system permease protein